MRARRLRRNMPIGVLVLARSGNHLGFDNMFKWRSPVEINRHVRRSDLEITWRSELKLHLYLHLHLLSHVLCSFCVVISALC